MEKSEQLMRSVTGALGKNDFSPFLAALHDDVVWVSAAEAGGPFRFGGEYRTRMGVEYGLSRVRAGYVIKKFDVKEIIAGKDAVWGLFDAELLYAPYLMTWIPSQEISIEMAIRWKLKDDRIIEHRSFFDTALFFVKHGTAWPALPT